MVLIAARTSSLVLPERCRFARRVSKAGMVRPADMAVAMGIAPESPALPAWVTAWTEAEAQRPWPPAR